MPRRRFGGSDGSRDRVDRVAASTIGRVNYPYPFKLGPMCHERPGSEPDPVSSVSWRSAERERLTRLVVRVRVSDRYRRAQRILPHCNGHGLIAPVPFVVVSWLRESKPILTKTLRARIPCLITTCDH